MNLTDINEVKGVLGIPYENTAEDKKLNFFITTVSELVEKYLNRDLFKKSRTQYYSGTGTQKLLLRARPVAIDPTPLVYIDMLGFFGASSGAFTAATSQLTYGTDFALWIDRDDGGSDRGILIRRNNFWPRPVVRETGLLSPFIGEGFGNVKVVYTGGYTYDDLPSDLVLGVVELVAKMRGYFPNAMPINSESYEERSVSFAIPDRDWLMGQVKYRFSRYRNYRF